MRAFALCLSLFGIAGAAYAAPAGRNPIACETYSYRELLLAGKLDVMDVPALYEKEGIAGISLNERYLKSRDEAYVDRFKAAAAAHGRTITCFVIDGTLAGADEAKRRKQIEHDKESLRIAHRLGVKTVRINVGSTGAEKADDAAGVERAIAAFREMLPLARELNIRISIENHGGASRSAANILRIIQGTDPKWVGALIDFGNFSDDSRYEEIAKLLPYVFAVHVKTRDSGAGYDLDRVFGMLRKAGYKGPLSIEYEGKSDSIEGVRASRKLIAEHWK